MRQLSKIFVFSLVSSHVSFSANTNFCASLYTGVVEPKVKILMGAATIHRYVEPRVVASDITVTVWVPSVRDPKEGRLVNLNSVKISRDNPIKNMVIGDGGVTRAFVGVNSEVGGDLDNSLNKILEKLQKDLNLKSLDSLNAKDEKRILAWLKINVNKIIKWTAKSSLNDGRAELPWDLAIKVPKNLDTVFVKAGSESIFHFPLSSEFEMPVVPLEKYIAIGKGYCLQKALLASQLLQKIKIPHRIVNGAISESPGVSGGHTWIELEGGRILDVAWEKLGNPTKQKDVYHPDWIFFAGGFRFENQNYPVLMRE